MAAGDSRRIDAATHNDRQKFEYLAITDDGDVATIALGVSPDRLRAWLNSSGLMAATRHTP